MTQWTSRPPSPTTCGAASRRPSAAKPRWRPRPLPCPCLRGSFPPSLGVYRTASLGLRPGPAPLGGLGGPWLPGAPRAPSRDLARGQQRLLRPASGLRGTARPCSCAPARTGPRAVRWSASSVPRGPQKQPQPPGLRILPGSVPTLPATPQNLLLSCRPKRPCCRSTSWTPATQIDELSMGSDTIDL